MSNYDELATAPTAWQRTLNPDKYPMPSMDNSSAQLSAAYSARYAWWLTLAETYANHARHAKGEGEAEIFHLLDAGHDALVRANFWRREADALALVAAGESRH